MNSRAIHVLFVLGMAAAIAVGAVLGNGHAVLTHSHMLAFADDSSICPDKRSNSCTALYILNGDQVPQVLSGSARLLIPATAMPVANLADPIVGISWSADASTLAYLVGRQAIVGRYNLIQTVDLWRVRISDGANELVARDVASTADQREYLLGEAIRWVGDQPALGATDTWTRTPQNVRRFLSPDKALASSREWGIDSNWICIRMADTPTDSLQGCFGDGRFSEPVWAPF